MVSLVVLRQNSRELSWQLELGVRQNSSDTPRATWGMKRNENAEFASEIEEQKVSREFRNS
mgnify:CR=1 FL=1